MPFLPQSSTAAPGKSSAGTCSHRASGHRRSRAGGCSAARFGSLRGAPPGLKLRHDNGLVFGSRQYVALARDYGLTQEYIAPHTPEQNGLCERFIRTFKEECVWLHCFSSIPDAKKNTSPPSSP
jgi:transposase InsO family protein